MKNDGKTEGGKRKKRPYKTPSLNPHGRLGTVFTDPD